MKRSVVIYCPDRHIVYDGRTPDEIGVGGGITARVRMARALARRGHEVHMVVNCPQAAEFDGVHYWPLDGRGPTEGDVLVANTSGGALDLTPAVGLAPGFALRLVWVQGTILPGGLDRLQWDWLVAVSNFISAHAQREWGFPVERIFVAYNGFEAGHFTSQEATAIARDPFLLIYAAHPSKGLQAAVALVSELRKHDERFSLRVLGGNRLWGQREESSPGTDGVMYGGLVGQRRLAGELLGSGFSIQLQTREEPGALLIPEALRAGCILVASPVGCYPEMVLDAENGVLVDGDPGSLETIRQASDAILALVGDPLRLKKIRANASAVPWSSDMMAEVWEQHWEWAMGGGQIEPTRKDTCTRCASEVLRMADGAHCLTCSAYLPSWPTSAATAACGKPG